MVKAILGARIRKLRKEKGLSQEALAEQADLHYIFVGRVERGEKNPSLINLQKLAKALEISLIDLFDLPELKERPDDFKKKLAQEMKHFDEEIAETLLKLIKAINVKK
ncbi:MAG: helix-turn-helix transcriptional regulator [Thermodesulfobacteriota bacterium]|jgi:transcriptional regulator with XRE-family HTH domain|nr:MAG: helix-turn-helix transcriptional regulator [Thermodesulfobacteriota bacterium]